MAWLNYLRLSIMLTEKISKHKLLTMSGGRERGRKGGREGRGGSRMQDDCWDGTCDHPQSLELTVAVPVFTCNFLVGF